MLPGNQSNPDVQFFVQGPDLEELSKYSAELAAKMKAIPELTDVATSLRNGKPEMQLTIDRPRAYTLGVTVAEIENSINTSWRGR
ncbi:hypothetical protein BH10ACI4_BH10ACI4_02120 [soil metagenome]